MKYTVTGIKNEKSVHGNGVFFDFIFFKDEEGKSWLTNVDPRMGNAHRWRPVIEAGVGSVWEGIRVWSEKKRILDADSFPKRV